jgi:hypothetical protein
MPHFELSRETREWDLFNTFLQVAQTQFQSNFQLIRVKKEHLQGLSMEASKFAKTYLVSY